MTRLHTVVHRVRDALHELRRRHVFRVGFGYAAGTWLVLQVATALFPILDISTDLLRPLTLILLLGFPLALVLAWAYDITPEGIQRTADEPADVPADGSTAADTPAPLSVAALPFADRSAGAAFQYLGDGITDELINALARVPGLRVVARTSSFALRAATVDAREIGARLHVRHLIDGSVRVSGDRLRVHAQLVDTADGYTVWSETYERPIADILAVEEHVARAVLRTLQPHLVSRAQPLLSVSTGDVEAYTCYLRGRSLWNERTPAALRQAIGHFEDAIRRDATFAHAHAGLADCHAILVDYAIDPPAVGMPAARAASARALELAQDLAESRTSAALVRQLDGDWAGAEDGFRRALSLNPAYTVARQRLALLLAWSNRSEEARAQIALAVECDPLSPVLATAHGWIEYYDGAARAARDILAATVAEYPQFAAAHVPLALALLRLDAAADAVSVIEQHLALTGRTAAGVALHALTLGRAGRRDDAAAHLRSLERQASSGAWVSPYYLAIAALGAHDEDKAIRHLQRAVNEGSPQLIYLQREPLFEPLRARAEFCELIAALVPAVG